MDPSIPMATMGPAIVLWWWNWPEMKWNIFISLINIQSQSNGDLIFYIPVPFFLHDLPKNWLSSFNLYWSMHTHRSVAHADVISRQVHQTLTKQGFRRQLRLDSWTQVNGFSFRLLPVSTSSDGAHFTNPRSGHSWLVSSLVLKPFITRGTESKIQILLLLYKPCFSSSSSAAKGKPASEQIQATAERWQPKSQQPNKKQRRRLRVMENRRRSSGTKRLVTRVSCRATNFIR